MQKSKCTFLVKRKCRKHCFRLTMNYEIPITKAKEVMFVAFTRYRITREASWEAKKKKKTVAVICKLHNITRRLVMPEFRLFLILKGH